MQNLKLCKEIWDYLLVNQIDVKGEYCQAAGIFSQISNTEITRKIEFYIIFRSHCR